MEIIKSEEQQQKKIEVNLRALWDIISKTNIRVVEVPIDEQRKGRKNI